MRRLLIGCVLMAVAVGLGASPAQAQTKVRKDPVGDAPSFVDITSAKVQNNAKKFALTVRFTEVVHKNTTAFALFGSKSEDAEAFYLVGSIPIGGGKHDSRLYRLTEDGQQRLRCGLRTSWDHGDGGSVRFVLPQRCLGADAGTLVTVPMSIDKQSSQARSARWVPKQLRSIMSSDLRRGDVVEPDAELEDGDMLDSLFITTRRGR